MKVYPPMIFDTEVFKPITNDLVQDIEPDRYLIGNLGSVFDKKLNSYRPLYASKNGYIQVHLNTLNGYKILLLHRLVCMAFNNGDFSLQVNHINGFKFVNEDTNLEWVTPRENLMHALDMGLNYRGEDKPNAILSNDQVHMICKMLEDGYNYFQIANQLNIDYEYIKDILIDIKRGKSWKTISCQYHLPDYKISNDRILTTDQVNAICQIYQDNPKATAGYVFDRMGMHFDNKFDRNKMRHVVDSIKEKKAYKDISRNYDF